MKPIQYSKETSIKATKTTVKMVLLANIISILSVPFMGTEFLKLIVVFNIVLLGVDYLYDLVGGKRGKVSK